MTHTEKHKLELRQHIQHETKVYLAKGKLITRFPEEINTFICDYPDIKDIYCPTPAKTILGRVIQNLRVGV